MTNSQFLDGCLSCLKLCQAQRLREHSWSECLVWHSRPLWSGPCRCFPLTYQVKRNFSPHTHISEHTVPWHLLSLLHMLTACRTQLRGCPFQEAFPAPLAERNHSPGPVLPLLACWRPRADCEPPSVTLCPSAPAPGPESRAAEGLGTRTPSGSERRAFLGAWAPAYTPVVCRHGSLCTRI